MKTFTPSILLICLLLLASNTNAQTPGKVFPGADEQSPSRAQYFSWINNTNEGPTEEQTLINLDFFQWLHDEYGMILDIYAFDAGAIDGKRFYGSTQSERFKKQFPNGFDPVYKKAKKMGTRLGVWGGPDGFGNTPEERQARIDQMVGLCKDYEFALFKFDAVCGQLRPDKEEAFIEMMTQSRKYSPDLILLNHRLALKEGKAHATTFLWEGAETYTGVWSSNDTIAPHHRAGGLSRGLTPELKRLTEDHGVCLSSYLDYWDDELILQAFNRSLILAPEIYGNPWFLPDEDYPKLARIYNLHRRYRDILVNGMALPDSYGPHAVARGDEQTRLISLRNLSWEKKTYRIKLSDEIGLQQSDQVEVRQYHPTERYLGKMVYGSTVEVEVLPYRSCLVYVGPEVKGEPTVVGADYQLLRRVEGKPVQLSVLGMPGSNASFSFKNARPFSTISLQGEKEKKFNPQKNHQHQFAGQPLKADYHRTLKGFNPVAIPADAAALYEATVFAADNNALEVRAIQSSGWSAIPSVRKAQEAFFEQNTFVERGIWDKNLFDGDRQTGFNITQKYKVEQRVKGGCFRLDLGEVQQLDEIKIIVANEYELQPQLIGEANWVEYSSDLKTWKKTVYIAGIEGSIQIAEPFRYLKIPYFPQRIVEIEGYKNGQSVTRNQWRASNLFAPLSRMEAQKAWKSTFIPTEIPKGSYLCIALDGEHGIEGAYAAAKIGEQVIGCPDRATAYPSNTWEYANVRSKKNYTYYLPLNQNMIGKEIELYVLAYDQNHLDFQPRLWITTKDIPFEQLKVELK